MTARTAPAIVLAVMLAAASAAASAPAGSSAPRAVKVVLKEWTLKPSAPTVRAGSVTFVVRNGGAIPHEFVILRTIRHHHALAVRGGQAVEAGTLGEIEELRPGQTKRLTLRLRLGKYVLLCNLPGHYKAGQYAAFRVT